MKLVTSITLFLAVFKSELRFCSADLAQQYRDEGIVPTVLDKAPDKLLAVSFGNNRITFGEEIALIKVQNIPTIGWNFDATKYYTLFMNDPDVPSRSKPTLAEFLHWAVVNIPGNNFSKGQTLAIFLPSTPVPGSGFHRYIFTVYEQPKKLNFTETPITTTTAQLRVKFSLRKFAKKYNLIGPVAGNMYKTELLS